MIAKVVEIRNGRAVLEVEGENPIRVEKSAVGFELGQEVELISHKGHVVVRSSVERLEALAEKMYSDLVAKHGAHRETVDVRELIITLLCAENDVDEPPLDFYAVARWIVQDLSVAEAER